MLVVACRRGHHQATVEVVVLVLVLGFPSTRVVRWALEPPEEEGVRRHRLLEEAAVRLLLPAARREVRGRFAAAVDPSVDPLVDPSLEHCRRQPPRQLQALPSSQPRQWHLPQGSQRVSYVKLLGPSAVLQPEVQAFLVPEPLPVVYFSTSTPAPASTSPVKMFRRCR